MAMAAHALRMTVWSGALCALAMGRAETCRADVKIAALVVGNNRPLAAGHGAGADDGSPPLRFADDDAAAFDELVVELHGRGRLLTVMDRETEALGTAGWLGAREAGPLRGWLGVLAGGGLVSQTADGASARWSGALTAGPAAGAEVSASRRLGLWVEAQISGNVYRQESRMVASLSPSLWMGVSLGL